MADAKNFVHAVLAAESFVTQHGRVQALIRDVIAGLAELKHMAHVDLLRERLSVFVGREQRILAVNDELRQPHATARVVQEKAVEETLAVVAAVRSWYIVDEATEKPA